MATSGELSFPFGDLFEDGPYGMLVASGERKLFDANARACVLLGYERYELMERGLNHVADPTDERWEVALSGQERGELDLRLRRRDGSVFAAWVVLTGRSENDGDPLGVVFRERPLETKAERGEQDAAAHVGRGLVDTGLGLVTLYGADHTLRYLSPSVGQILGYDPEELLGISAFDLVHPEDLATAAHEAQAAASGRRSPPLRYRHKDGSWVYLEEVTSNLLPHVPSVEGPVVDSRDFAERERAEDALRQTRDRYRVLVGGSLGVMEIAEPDGTVVYASPAVEGVLGYAPKELIEKNALDYVHPEDEQRAREAFVKATRSGGPAASSEFRMRHADGSWRHLRVRVSNYLDDPSVGALMVDLNDVTKQKEAEEALRQSEGRYRAVVEQASEGIYLVDVQTMSILEANAALCDTLGYTANELRRLKPYDIVAHEPESVDRNVRRTLEEKRSHIGEQKYRRKDGSLADVDVYAGVVSHADRDVLSVVAQDVSGRKRTEENLRRSLGVLLALREAGQILGSTLETEEIVTRLLTIMRGVSGLTAAVISVEDEFGQPKIWREVGLEGLWRKARYASHAEEARRAVLDAGEHQLFRLQSPEGSGQLVGLCLPLRMKDRIAGVLEAYGPESLAGDDAVDILRSLAAQAASALENARLYGELAERERRLADLIGQLFTAQEEERRRVAYEVHDGLAQVAAAAHQHLQGFARFHPPDSEDGRALLSQALELVQRTVGEARRVIANLRPTALDDFGLGTALRIETDRLREEGYRIDYESNLDEDERLPVAVETALFRIAQEALTNVRRHAGSPRVHVTLDRLEGRARLGIRDWGRGFDPAAPRVGDGPGERVGLNSMQERVALLGGSFLVKSRPGLGALVTVEVPLPAEEPDNGEGSPMNPAEAEGSGFLIAELGEDS